MHPNPNLRPGNDPIDQTARALTRIVLWLAIFGAGAALGYVVRGWF
jgi:hypothetical protein